MADSKPPIIKFCEITINFLCLYIASALMWIGAEYVFDGMVHSSHVDSAVNCLLAYYILRNRRKEGAD